MKLYVVIISLIIIIAKIINGNTEERSCSNNVCQTIKRNVSYN